MVGGVWCDDGAMCRLYYAMVWCRKIRGLSKHILCWVVVRTARYVRRCAEMTMTMTWFSPPAAPDRADAMPSPGLLLWSICMHSSEF